MPDARTLSEDPNWLPHRYNPAQRAIQFVHVPVETHRAVTFLSDDYLPKNAPRAVVALDAVAGAMGEVPAARIHFVFHTAFCCSTLLARALDLDGCSFGMKEPMVLNDLAVVAYRGKTDPHALSIILRLLARPVHPGAVAVIKPSNEANILVPALLSAVPQARAIAMSSSLDDFLLSIARKGLWGRGWARRLFARDDARQANRSFSPEESFAQTDLQIAGRYWLAQRTALNHAIDRHGDRIASIDAAVLLGHPASALAAMCDHLGLAPTTATLDQSIADVFGEDAKRLGRTFDPDQRAAQQAAHRAALGEEIDMVGQWIAAVAQHGDQDLALARPVVLP